jgi:hypothetical protein
MTRTGRRCASAPVTDRSRSVGGGCPCSALRATDGSEELPVACYELFSQTQVLGRMAMLQRMLAGLSTRRYPVGLEPVGQKVEKSARVDIQQAQGAGLFAHDSHQGLQVQITKTARRQAGHRIQRVVLADTPLARLGVGHPGGEHFHRADNLPSRVTKGLTAHTDRDAVSVLVVQVEVGLAGLSVLHHFGQRAPVQPGSTTEVFAGGSGGF